jgi:hypothetical protein
MKLYFSKSKINETTCLFGLLLWHLISYIVVYICLCSYLLVFSNIFVGSCKTMVSQISWHRFVDVMFSSSRVYIWCKYFPWMISDEVMVPMDDGDGWHTYFLGFSSKNLDLPSPVMEKGGRVPMQGGKRQYRRKSGSPARERAGTTE